MPKTNAKQNINQSRSANVSIEDLYNKYVKTIDSFRSFAIPPSFDGVASQKPRDDKKASRYSGGKNKNPSEFQESRTHAFYRMVGFPVVSKNQYYNPGYNPFITNQVKYTDIDKAFFKDYPDLVKAITSRELSFKEKINMFRNKTDLSVVYSGALPITKKFNIIGHDLGDPLKAAKQEAVMSERTFYIKTQPYKLNDGESALQEKYISKTSHILKPFIVHPDIANCISPSGRMIAVPFLRNPTDVKVTDSKTIKKTILEQIITARLSDNDSGVLKDELEYLLSTANTTYSTNTLIDSFNALGGNDNFAVLKSDQDLIDKFQEYSSTELKNIELFSSAIRSVVTQLNDAIEVWNKVNTEQQVEPVANTYGPEFGGVARTSLKNPSNIDISIAYLKLKQALAQGSATTNTTQYAQPSGADAALVKDNTNNLSKLIKQRDDYTNQAMQALKLIEIITGEVSGLGLIDILSIHLTLWSIDMRYLLGLLDNDSLQRCYEFNDKMYGDVEVKKQANGNRPSISETLTEFEKVFFNILNFADAAFDYCQFGLNKNRDI